MRFNIKLLILPFILCHSINVSAQAGFPFTKNEIIEIYNKLYKSSEITSFEWNAEANRCDCGKPAKEIYEKAENRINFFRIVSGLDLVKINPKSNLEAQSAAYLVKVNKMLTHYPSKSMNCYSESAANGCKKSCLGFSDFKNFMSSAFITGFIDDYGTDNYAVGHRRWLLYSKLTEFGYGATENSEAILVADGITNKKVETPEYMSYPWNGYVPANLIFPKWSFSIPEDKNVDFSQTKISMFDGKGNPLNIQQLQLMENFLDHTIVWIATSLFTDDDIKYSQNKMEQNGFLNQKIRVHIRNVKINQEMKNFEYFVEPFKI